MIINGRSYYKFILRGRTAGPQENFGIGSFLAFFSAKVFRGGPRAFLQFTTCFVLVVLLTKLLPLRLIGLDITSNVWNWRATGHSDVLKSTEDDDGSKPGGLRVVVFGENDVATPDRREGDAQGRGWTEHLCEELDCTSYLSLIPTPDDPSRVMASTKLYATSVEQTLNLTFENYGPGLDYNFMLDQFPIEWKVSDFSKQVDQFLSMKKPRHAPAETIWVLSFGMWDIWSLATEPLTVSKAIVDSVIDHIFVEIERLYESSQNETSIAWSGPDPDLPKASAVSKPVSTPTPDPEKSAIWTRDRDHSTLSPSTSSDPSASKQKHFRILIPRLFDPSLTPGWHDSRPKVPAVHSKAEQLRNAAALTIKWNDKMWSAMAEWVKTEEPVEIMQLTSADIKLKSAEEIIREKMVTTGQGVGRRQKQPKKNGNEAGRRRVTTDALLGRGHIVAREEAAGGGDAEPPPPQESSDDKQVDVEAKEGQEAPAGATEGKEPQPVSDGLQPPQHPPQRDGIFYDLNKYLEELIVQRQMGFSGLRDARKSGKLTEEDGFAEVWKPCVGKEIQMPEKTGRDEEAPRAADATESPPAAKGEDVVPGPDAAYEKRRTIRGRTPPGPSSRVADEKEAPPSSSAAEIRAEGNTTAVVAVPRICDDPDEHLFFTGFTVSRRAVRAIARQAADLVRRNETLRAAWDSSRKEMAKLGG